MALAQQNFAPERIARIERRYAEALKARGIGWGMFDKTAVD
ncbi:hypothetical protein [Tistrella mobilis]